MSAARALSKMATLGYACICIGLILFIYGKVSNNLTVDLIGGRVLVIGIMLLAVRILFWIAAKIVEQTLNSISSQNLSSSQCTRAGGEIGKYD